MKRLLLCVAIALLLAAGCLTPGPFPPAGGSRLQILSPSEPFPIFGGEGVMTETITGETPLPPMNVSLGYVVIDPGNGTPPHRLLHTSELIYVDMGTARIRCDHETVTAERGELVLIPESVFQSIDSVGDAQLRYVSAIQPPYSDEIDIAGDALHSCGIQTDSVPIVVRDPGEGIEWDFDTGTVIYTLINPVLMPEKEIPIDYSVAFAEIRPGGHVVKNRLIGRTEVLYVIEGEIEISSPGAATIRVPAAARAISHRDASRNTEIPGKGMHRSSPSWIRHGPSRDPNCWTEGSIPLFHRYPLHGGRHPARSGDAAPIASVYSGDARPPIVVHIHCSSEWGSPIEREIEVRCDNGFAQSHCCV